MPRFFDTPFQRALLATDFHSPFSCHTNAVLSGRIYGDSELCGCRGYVAYFSVGER